MTRDYNSFVVINCKSRKVALVTSSARKAYGFLEKGMKVEVWNSHQMVETIYYRDKQKRQNPFAPYIECEKEYIRMKQERATERNAQKRRH